MKINALVKYWDKHASGRLTREPSVMSVCDQHHEYLQRLSARYPLKTTQELLRDLISTALDELETSFPYQQGSRVVALDEDGDEIYEDEGLTPRFVRLSQKHIQRLKSRELESSN